MSHVDYDPFAGGELASTCKTTEAQKEIFTSAHWGRDASCSYNEAFSLRFKGALDIDALKRALAGLVARHEALRMALTPDGLTACILKEMTLPFTTVDLSDAAPDALAALHAEEGDLEFDLVRGPLIRAKIAKLKADEHELIVCAHHIVCDGWSIAVLVKDLAALYSGRTLGPAGSYSAYSRAEHERRAAGAHRDDEAFWLKMYQSGVPVLDLPLDNSRPPVRPYRSRREDLRLPAPLIKQLKALGAKHGASFFTVLFAGYQALLHRLSGHEDVVVGVPAAGQAVDGDEALVGHCVNMLPILGRLSGAMPFSDFLRGLRATVLDAFDHQRFTYGSLLTKLKVERDPSRLPLVSVIFNLDQGLSAAHFEFRGLTTRFATTPRRYENFELFFNVIEIDGETTIECQYLSDLFGQETIRARLEAYVALLEALASAPATPIGALNCVPRSELLAMRAWNQAAALPPEAATIHGMIAAQAGRTPDRTAVSSGERSLTYDELQRATGRVAAYLRSLGVRPGTMVGVSVERSLDMLVTLIGILRAGGAYVPVDPGLPEDRIRFMLEETEAALLVVTAKTRALMPKTAARVVDLDEERPALAKLEPLAGGGTGPDDASPDAIAYVIFTSGSTGRPKGVLVPHRGVANLLSSMTRWPGLGADDRQLALTTISFDVHVPDLYLPLVVGAKLVIATKDETLEGERLRALLERERITFLQATPASWRLILDAGWPGDRRLKAVSTGEPLPRDLAALLLPKVGELWNMYGPTETTVYSTGWRVRDAAQPILIGKPVDNTTLYIVNEQLAPCPVGVPGELLIGGVGVTRGYLKRPDLTAEKFIAGPDGERLYRTGDLARFRADGMVECLGRNDHQVKVRGYRIELGEIEAELAKLPGIRQAAVGVRDRAAGDRRLVAWYVKVDQAKTPAVKDLRDGLSAFLPEYMVPQHFLGVAALPLTPSGKVDRARLPSPFQAAAETMALAEGGFDLRPRAPGTAPILSLVQQRIVALERSRPGLALFNLPTGFRIFGPFNQDHADAALERFVNRHEALRTAFSPDPVVAARVAYRATRVDLTGQSREAQDTRLQDDFDRAAHARQDLTAAPLFRATIYRIAEQEHVLFIMAHQAVWDGWSFDIFVREFSALYEALAAGTDAKLPVLKVGYADYALWHRQLLKSAVMQEQLAYWRAKLKDLPPPLALSQGRPRPSEFSYAGNSVSFLMPRELADALTTVGREVGATLFMVLLAAYKVMLHRLSGATDILVATPVRGRNEADLEDIVGSFVNQIVLRTRLDPSQAFLDYLKDVRQAALEGMAHDALPFERLHDAFGDGPGPGRAPFVQAQFSFQDARARNTAFGKLPFKQLNIEPRCAPCELNFWVKESHENLAGSMNYATDLFDDRAMRAFLEGYDALLAALVMDPRQTLRALAAGPDEALSAKASGWLKGIPEVEQTLAGIEAVKEAAVAVQYDEQGRCRLVAYFSLVAGEFVTATDLRRAVRLRLGDALVPHAVIEIEQFPYLPSGKVDKGKLPPAYKRAFDAKAAPGDAAAAASTKPRTPAETVLAAIWAELLGVEEVPVNANFFELGGHSLLAIQMIGRVERQTGVKLGRMAVTLNTLGQIAKTMAMQDAADGQGGDKAAPTDALGTSSPNGQDAPAAAAPPAAEARSGLAGKLWRRLKGGPGN